MLKGGARGNLSPEESKRLVAVSEDEKSFQAWVRDTFLRGGWLFYHTFNSKRSDEGFFDVVAIHPHPQKARIVFAELKKVGGTQSKDQLAWQDAVDQVGEVVNRHRGVFANTDGSGFKFPPTIAAYLWSPEDKDEILKVAFG